MILYIYKSNPLNDNHIMSSNNIIFEFRIQNIEEKKKMINININNYNINFFNPNCLHTYIYT